MRLSPEEVIFLVKDGKAVLIKYPDLQSPPTNQYKEEIINFHNKLFCEEKKIYLNLRKDELNLTSKKIIAGKRKHGDTRSDTEILNAELQKSSIISENAIVWPTFIAPLDSIQGKNNFYNDCNV